MLGRTWFSVTCTACEKPQVLELLQWGVAHAKPGSHVFREQFDGGAVGDGVSLGQVLHGLDQRAEPRLDLLEARRRGSRPGRIGPGTSWLRPACAGRLRSAGRTCVLFSCGPGSEQLES